MIEIKKINKIDFVFKHVPIYVNNIKEFKIIPDPKIISILKQAYNNHIGHNNDKNTWDIFHLFYIHMNEKEPTNPHDGKHLYTLTESEKKKYLHKHITMDIVFLKKRYYQNYAWTGVIRGVFQSISFMQNRSESDDEEQNESDDNTVITMPMKGRTKRKRIIEDSDESDIDTVRDIKKHRLNNNPSDDEFSLSSSSSDDEFPAKTNQRLKTNKKRVCKYKKSGCKEEDNDIPGWLKQTIESHEKEKVKTGIYIGLVFEVLSHDQIGEFRDDDKKRIIQLLFQNKNEGYKEILLKLYDITKNYSFLDKVIKRRFNMFVESDFENRNRYTQLKILEVDDKYLNFNYIKPYISFRSSGVEKKNHLNGMLLWLYDIYNVPEEDREFFNTPKSNWYTLPEHEPEISSIDHDSSDNELSSIESHAPEPPTKTNMQLEINEKKVCKYNKRGCKYSTCASRQALYSHQKICNFQDDYENKMKELKDSKKVFCNICRKNFANRYTLKNHFSKCMEKTMQKNKEKDVQKSNRYTLHENEHEPEILSVNDDTQFILNLENNIDIKNILKGKSRSVETMNQNYERLEQILSTYNISFFEIPDINEEAKDFIVDRIIMTNLQDIQNGLKKWNEEYFN